MIKNFIQKARALGFMAVGFSPPETPHHYADYSSWIARKKHGSMGWMERHQNLRKDPSGLLNGCRTMISLAYPYPKEKPNTPDGLTTARYSQPDEEDYHIRLKRILRGLVNEVNRIYPGSRSRICVDSAPLLERSIAWSSGVGFFWKEQYADIA